MKGMVTFAVSFGLIMAAASVTVAALPVDQGLMKKQAQETSVQTLRDFMKLRKVQIKPMQGP